MPVDIRINEIQTDISVLDPAALLTPQVREQIVRAVLEALEEGEPPFLSVVESLARRGRVAAHDVNGSQWQEISSPETRLHAEWLVRAYGDELSGLAHSSSRAATSDPGRTLSYIEGLLSEKNARHYVLFNPGPVLTSPRVKSALVHHDVCHRDSDYSVVQVTQHHGRRCSTAVAYLKPARARTNLTVQTGSLVERVLIRATAGRLPWNTGTAVSGTLRIATARS